MGKIIKACSEQYHAVMKNVFHYKNCPKCGAQL